MNFGRISAARLAAQGITADRRFDHPEEVVAHLGAVQAQDYGQALWAIGARLASGSIDAVTDAIAQGRIIRTWPMRGTIHFVLPENAHWMVRLSAPRLLGSDKRRLDQLSLDVLTIEQAGQVLSGAMQGGKFITRPAIMQLLNDANIRTDGQRGYHILWYLAQSGLLYIGPMEGKQQTFALLDAWVPQNDTLTREASLTKLATLYFNGHGPATVHDFAWWAGLTLNDARLGLEAAKPGLCSTVFDGSTYWSALDVAGTEQTDVIYLLPGFDECILGYKDRRAILDPQHARNIAPGNNGIFLPIVVQNGRVIGTWRRTIKIKHIEAVFSLFDGCSVPDAMLADAVHRYKTFMGLPLRVTKGI